MQDDAKQTDELTPTAVEAANLVAEQHPEAREMNEFEDLMEVLEATEKQKFLFARRLMTGAAQTNSIIRRCVRCLKTRCARRMYTASC